MHDTDWTKIVEIKRFMMTLPHVNLKCSSVFLLNNTMYLYVLYLWVQTPEYSLRSDIAEKYKEMFE